MTRHHLICLATLFAIGLLLGGCAVPSGDGNTNTNANVSDNDNDAAGDGSDLTELQKAATEAAFDAVETAGESVVAVLPSITAADVFGGMIDAPTCPTLAGSLEDGVVTVALDYGTGCFPPLFPDATVSGTVAGTVDVVARSMSITFTEFTVNGDVLNGDLSGNYVRANGIITIELTFDLAFEEFTLTGTVSISMDEGSGTISITEGTLTIASVELGALDLTVDGVVIDPAANGNFYPEAGTVTFEIPNEGAGPETITITVEFTEQTPVDESVIVTIGEGEPFTYTPGDEDEDGDEGGEEP